MKKILFLTLLSLISKHTFSQDEIDIQKTIDSIEKTFTYQHGTIELRNGIGKIAIPKGFKYLDPIQSERLLVDIWGNPKISNMSLGMILPENQGVMADKGYVFNIRYDQIGYVKDDDANDIDYNELLTELQTETELENKERQRSGYETISIVGWASKPFYDGKRKILHWAQEIKFGASEVNTLNYNVRLLGRKGVLILNAITTMPNLPMVKRDLPKVLDIVTFNEGYQYADFDESMDQVAAWTVGGLVAGKILAKGGIIALLIKFWKVIAIAFAGIGGAIWKNRKRKKEEEERLISEPKKELSE